MRCAIVSGAAGGIGLALVAAFREAGFRVIATDRVTLPPTQHCDAFVQADLQRTVIDPAYATEVFARIRSHIGNDPLATLVNNAAVQVLGGVADLSVDDWQQTLNVNVLAPFVWTQAFLPELETARGCVVNISSIHARLTKQGFVAYATSKAALSGLTRSMAVDVGDRVRINAIEPAAIATPMLQAGFAQNADQFERLKHVHPAGRIGRPEEVAALALALSDGHMDFVNGACISLDGAISARLHDPA